MSERDWTPSDRADEMRDEEERRQERGMGARHDRYHDCWKCGDGSQPCANGDPGNCEYPHARND